MFLISAYLEDSLNRTTFDLRDKTALKFERDAVDGLTIEAARRGARRLRAQGQRLAPDHACRRKADFSSVDGLVGRLFQARMKSVVTDGRHRRR